MDLNNPIVTPFSGGTHVVEEGKLTPDALHRGSLLAFGLGMAVFATFLPLVGWPAFACAAAGAALGYAYTAPPFRLCYRGFGEFTVAVVDGPLIALTVCYTQTARFSPGALATGLVLGLLASAILTMNEFPDIVVDRRGNKRNLVVPLGLPRAAILHSALLLAGFALLIVVVLLGALPRACVFGLCGLASAIPVMRIPKTDLENVDALTRACGGTIRTQMLTWLFMCTGFVWALWQGGAA